MIAVGLSACHGTDSSNNTVTLTIPNQIYYAGINGPSASIPITVSQNLGTSFGSALGSTFAVLGIQVLQSSIPAGVSIQYQDANGNVNSSGCASTTVGQTCTILLTGNGQGSSGNYILEIISQTGPTGTADVNLQWPSTTLQAIDNDGAQYNLTLTNASQVPITNLSYQLSDSPVIPINTSNATCQQGQTLAANGSCILGQVMDSSQDPSSYTVLVNGSNMQAQQTNTIFSPYCQAGISDFSAEQAQWPYAANNDNNIEAETPTSTDIAWGWNAIRPLNFDYSACVGNAAWQQQRILAAAAYWVSTKTNYCHHHVPTYVTPSALYDPFQGKIANFQNESNCSTANNIYPGSSTYGENIRWNYTGSGNETAAVWQNPAPTPTPTNMSSQWLGMDCSDYTSMLYNFTSATNMDSAVAAQGGQSTSAEESCTPNTYAAGQCTLNSLGTGLGHLICSDGIHTDADSALCSAYGGYLSVGDSQGNYVALNTSVLSHLQTGDLLYFAIGDNGQWSSTHKVVHVVMWTGKQVGYGANDISPLAIAPDSHCPTQLSPTGWMPQVGDYVITDSHYQGPDYRVFTTQCYYGLTLWGARRIIGVSS
jgi:hypothetical protein